MPKIYISYFITFFKKNVLFVLKNNFLLKFLVFQAPVVPPARPDLREVWAGDVHPPGPRRRRRGRLFFRIIQRRYCSLFKTGKHFFFLSGEDEDKSVILTVF